MYSSESRLLGRPLLRWRRLLLGCSYTDARLFLTPLTPGEVRICFVQQGKVKNISQILILMKTVFAPRSAFGTLCFRKWRLAVSIAIPLFLSSASVRAQYSTTDLGPGVAYDINSSGKVAAFINGRPVVTDGANQQPVF